MTADRPFLARVRDSLDQLPSAERRLGEFVCDFPGELASYSASELAKLSHVSNATVTRFVQRLGYQTYEEARRHAREEKQTGSRLFWSKAHSGPERAPLSGHIDQSISNLEKTFLTIPDNQIDEAVSAMLTARKVWVIGFRSSQPLAAYLQWQMLQVAENIHLIPGPGQTLGEYIASISAEDMVIAFALRRRVSRMNDILSLIEKRGARTLYITDESAPLRHSANWHFLCETLAPGPLFNHVSVMALCHLLTTRAIEKAGPAARQRLRLIETMGDALDEL